MFYFAAKLLPVLHISYVSVIVCRINYALFTPIRRSRNDNEMMFVNNERKLLFLQSLCFSVNGALVDFLLRNTEHKYWKVACKILFSLVTLNVLLSNYCKEDGPLHFTYFYSNPILFAWYFIVRRQSFCAGLSTVTFCAVLLDISILQTFFSFLPLTER